MCCLNYIIQLRRPQSFFTVAEKKRRRGMDWNLMYIVVSLQRRLVSIVLAYTDTFRHPPERISPLCRDCSNRGHGRPPRNWPQSCFCCWWKWTAMIVITDFDVSSDRNFNEQHWVLHPGLLRGLAQVGTSSWQPTRCRVQHATGHTWT